MFVIARSDGSGAVTSVNAYDEYGIPASGNTGRFQYTGQQWLPELGMQHSRARIYSPTMGRFLQTDPIGYAGGMNLHAYVGNDPVNMVDPTGLQCEDIDDSNVVVCGDPPDYVTDETDVTVDECDIGRFWDAEPRHQMLCIMRTGQGHWGNAQGRAGISGSGAVTGAQLFLASQNTQRNARCSIPNGDLAREYRNARRIGLELLESIHRRREVSYTIYRNDRYGGNLETYFDLGSDGAVNPNLDRTGLVLVLSGHFHNRQVGPFFPLGYANPGPSDADRSTRADYPSDVPFVLHQDVGGGQWQDICF